jgi:hypothetical protein
LVADVFHSAYWKVAEMTDLVCTTLTRRVSCMAILPLACRKNLHALFIFAFPATPEFLAAVDAGVGTFLEVCVVDEEVALHAISVPCIILRLLGTSFPTY